ncbi:MFS transporter [Actinoplanes sp. NPDC051411]|uniref:MFS transporter n=1 Tax=Actinoplanes sp. NPDC051411 TaxID=3155522 RepID=UPI0034246490
MPLLPSIGRTVGTAVKAVRMLVRGSVRSGAWATRRVGSARARGAANEIGMIRLFDLHAVSCAGDALIAIGLAGTIFFNVPLGEARGKVALYLLITMVPFALLAPVVGPLLDHFRHGRRYALAVTMLGRAFLAYVISDHLFGWGLYPAAFGVLALSRAYGVARSAAVPRLLPEGVGLSQVGARASVYGTFAGAVVAPIGLLAFKFGPQWPLRVSSIIFIVGMVVALRLPPRADSDPPEAVPQPWRMMLRLGRGADRPLSGKLIVASLIGSASLRLLYGFLLLFLTFVVVGGQIDTHVFGADIGHKAAVGVVGGALAIGTFLSTAVGTRLRIRRPLALQAAGLAVTAAVAVLAAVFYSLLMVALFALIASIFSGIAKLAIDASIQERIPERLRASAFAHSETVLMIAWVAGGAIGIIPLPGRVGVALGALLAVAATVRAGIVAARLHNERLSGRSHEIVEPTDPDREPVPAAAGSAAGTTTGSSAEPSTAERRRAAPTDPWPEAPTVPARSRPNTPLPRTAPLSDLPPPPPGRGADRADRRPGSSSRATDRVPTSPAGGADRLPTSPAGGADRLPPPGDRLPPPPARGADRPPAPPAPAGRGSDRPLDPTLIDPKPARKGWFGRRKDKAKAPEPPTSGPSPAAPIPDDPPAQPAPTRSAAGRSAPGGSAPGRSSRNQSTPGQPDSAQPDSAPAQPDPALAPPGFHVYRPSSAAERSSPTPPDDDEDF